MASPEALAETLGYVESGEITRAASREVVTALVHEGGTAHSVVEARSLAAVRDDDALRPALEEVVAAHPEEVSRYRAGEGKLLGFLMGQAMRRLGKGADAARVRELLQEVLRS